MAMPSILNDRIRLNLLRSELNSLMWIDPFTDRGQYDPGWSCRDHAYDVTPVADPPLLLADG